jgi:phosphomevalonate kinase
MSGQGVILLAASALATGYLAYRQESDDTTVSAPGKALIAGGYLVLEQPNIGVVVSCTSRFFTTVKVCDPEELETPDEGGDGESAGAGAGAASVGAFMDLLEEDEVMIAVLSPQFYARFCFAYNIGANSLRQLEGNSNEFVQTCLQLVFSFARKSKDAGRFARDMKKLAAKRKVFGIKLRADNDFYSQAKLLQEKGLPLTSKSLSTLPSFIECPLNPTTGALEVAKTGMGSSAALTTSLVGALLKHLDIINLGTEKSGVLGLIQKSIHSINYILFGDGLMNANSADAYGEDRRIVHNLAQVAHSVAQGKIGSGFDVAAAVYGTQTYSRFPPTILDGVLANATVESIYSTVMDREEWTQKIQPLNLPLGFDIVMGDVCGGSESTSMAKAVLKWRKNSASAESKWRELGAINLVIYEKLRVLPSMELNFPHSFKAVVSYAASTCPAKWDVVHMTKNASSNHLPTEVFMDRTKYNQEAKKILELLIDIKMQFKRARAALKAIGEEAGVGIEPDGQTALVDETELVEGVLCAGVPGAGGEDAVFALTVSAGSRENVELMWSQWHLNNNGNNGNKKGPAAKVCVCPMMLHAETNKKSAGVRNESLVWASVA